MKNLLVISLLSLLTLPGCGLTQILPKSPPERAAINPQLGLNLTASDAIPTDILYPDFKTLGVETFRQLPSADLSWAKVEPTNDAWDFSRADEALMQAEVEPIVTLFSAQYASPNSPWSKQEDGFQKTVNADTQDYLETVVNRYKNYVKYWEIGNEMDRWVAFNPGAKRPTDTTNFPPVLPTDGFLPKEQGEFLAEVADIIRANDPDAIIIMPGLSGLSEYTYDTWLAGVLTTAGTTTFDVVSYHFQAPWVQLPPARKIFATKLETFGLGYKPVWLTETGSTSSPTLKTRTNYPNSESSQAADIFRRALIGFGHQDELVLWHGYQSSEGSTNTWRDYGLVSPNGDKKLAYHAFKLFAIELLPFAKVEALEESPVGVNVYKITRQDKTVRYVAWGKGNWDTPHGTSSITSVLPDANKAYKWTPVPRTITLTNLPVLIK